MRTRLSPPFKQIIDGRNKSKLSHRDTTTEEKKCNCQKPSECLMPNNCLAKSVIYQATVKASDKRPTQTYVGLTENQFKTRYTNHKASFNNLKKRNSTELSKYIWDLKDNNITYSITWKILKRAKSYSIIVMHQRDAIYASGRNISLFVNLIWHH